MGEGRVTLEGPIDRSGGAVATGIVTERGMKLWRVAVAAWRTADRIWRLAGDSATDFSHYSKRGILAALYTSTMLVFLDDASEGLAETQGFLDRRIEDVMRFEKMKAQWRSSERVPSISRFLGRLRYPAV